jgi:DNA (cytosine-5)-methyltransferase 1
VTAYYFRYGSCFSGIEAASVAWHDLMQPAWFCEIDKQASTVLARHWPHVPNHGDVATLPDKLRDAFNPPDVIVGGSPCQSYSVAGRKLGMKDPRGQLTMTFVDVIEANDQARRNHGQEETIVVWENVPGILSHAENPFGCFLGDLAAIQSISSAGLKPAISSRARRTKSSLSASETSSTTLSSMRPPSLCMRMHDS